jgi:hypothetical protein
MTFGSRLGQEAAGRSWKTESIVKNIQVLEDVRVVVSVDDGDGLSRASSLDAAEHDVVKSIGMANLSRCKADRIREGDAPTPVGRGECPV